MANVHSFLVYNWNRVCLLRTVTVASFLMVWEIYATNFRTITSIQQKCHHGISFSHQFFQMFYYNIFCCIAGVGLIFLQTYYAVISKKASNTLFVTCLPSNYHLETYARFLILRLIFFWDTITVYYYNQETYIVLQVKI